MRFRFLLAIEETYYENAHIPVSVKMACYDTISLRNLDCLARMGMSSLKTAGIK